MRDRFWYRVQEVARQKNGSIMYFPRPPVHFPTFTSFTGFTDKWSRGSHSIRHSAKRRAIFSNQLITLVDVIETEGGPDTLASAGRRQASTSLQPPCSSCGAVNHQRRT